MLSPKPALRYVGAGRFIPGIPDRDLETAELDVLAGAERRVRSRRAFEERLIGSGVYQAADPAASEKPADEKE